MFSSDQIGVFFTQKIHARQVRWQTGGLQSDFC